MSANSYRFTLGSCECIVINDGYRIYPSPANTLFDRASADELRRELASFDVDLAEWDQVPIPYLALVIYRADA